MTLIEEEPERASLFSEYYIFELENENYWGKPGAVFLDSPYLDTDLRAYYETLGDDSGRKWALSPEYETYDLEPEQIGKFAKAVGARIKLEPKERQSIPEEHPEYSYLDRAPGRWQEYTSKAEDYFFSEFETLLNEPSIDKARLLWRTMSSLSPKFLKASYRQNQSNPPHYAASTLVHDLRKAEWVPQRNGGDLLFVKPSEAVRDWLPSGFPFDNGAKWLEAIEFGKANQEYQGKSEAARKLGLSSPEEAQEAKEMLELKRKDPGGFKKWKESLESKPAFPEKPSRNPERRQKKFAEQYANASGKEYETRERSVRTIRGTVDPATRLKNQYTNEDDQMICQICKEEMPFKKRDGEYYFEAVEALKEHFNKEHEAQFLALCPLCAARYKEFVKKDEEVMQEVKNKLVNSDDLEISLQLGDLETSIRFVETHRQDLRMILQNSDDPTA